LAGLMRATALSSDKLHDQLADQPEPIHQVATDLLAFYLLTPTNIKATKKLETVEKVVSWKLKTHPQDYSVVAKAFETGFCHPGPFYLIHQYAQISYFLAFGRAARRGAVNPSDVANTRRMADSLAESIKNTIPARHVLLHLLFPDHFERIASDQDKKDIVEAFRDLAEGITDVDDALLKIRENLAHRLNRPGLDFYRDQDLRAQWERKEQPKQPSDVTQLFVFTASGPQAQRNLGRSIVQPVPLEICQKHLSPQDLQQLLAMADEESIFAWGATTGPSNTRNWDAMQPGDIGLVYERGMYSFVTRITYKIRSPGFARAVWPSADPETWELVYFLERPQTAGVAIEDLTDFLPGSYQGLMRITDDKVGRIVEAYGSLDAFIQERFLKKSTGVYLLLRSNEESEYKDEEGKAYRYTTNVANYKRIVPGARFIIDRKQRDGVALIGTGQISQVDREKEGPPAQLRAGYAGYRPLEAPRLLTPDELAILRSLPGYNVQYSIRNLTREVFERLLRGVTPPPSQTSLDELARVRSFVLRGPTRRTH
jgi:hypothetical protein